MTACRLSQLLFRKMYRCAPLIRPLRYFPAPVVLRPVRSSAIPGQDVSTSISYSRVSIPPRSQQHWLWPSTGRYFPLIISRNSVSRLPVVTRSIFAPKSDFRYLFHHTDLLPITLIPQSDTNVQQRSRLYFYFDRSVTEIFHWIPAQLSKLI